ncbi:hypothetical protein ACTMU2_18480 [Cupriavidus basilensis]
MQAHLLIRNACVRDDDPLTDIAITDGEIVAIEPGIEVPADEVIDAGGRWVIPGLVEAHLHLDKALLQLAPARALRHGSTRRSASPAFMKGKQERNDVLDRSRQVLDMAVKHGTVAVRAHPDVDLIQGLIGVETLLEPEAGVRRPARSADRGFPARGHPEVGRHLRADDRGDAAGVPGAWWGLPVQRADLGRHDAGISTWCSSWPSASTRRWTCMPISPTTPVISASRRSRCIAKKTIETGYQGKVALGHVTSLGALDPDELAPVAESLRAKQASTRRAASHRSLPWRTQGPPVRSAG